MGDSSSSSTPRAPQPTPAKPHSTLFKLGLAPLIVHFTSYNTGYIKGSTLENLDVRVIQRIKVDTAKNQDVRVQLGTNESVWRDLREVLEAAVPSLSDRCIGNGGVIGAGGNGGNGAAGAGNGGPAGGSGQELGDVPNSALIVANYGSLVEDLGRVNSLIGIARNVLTVGEVAQHLAAKVGFDTEVYFLITLCVRVTARGFEIVGGKGEEDEGRWQGVVNEFKKLLITCLQFINNLVVQNERMKLNVWVELFDSPVDGPNPTGLPLDEKMMDFTARDWAERDSGVSDDELRDGLPHVIRKFKDGLLAHLNRLDERRSHRTFPAGEPVLDKEHSSSPFLLYIGKVGREVKKDLMDAGKPAGAADIAAECKARWQKMTDEEQKSWDTYYTDLLARYRKEMLTKPADVESSGEVAAAGRVEQIQEDIRNMRVSSSSPSRQDQNLERVTSVDGPWILHFDENTSNTGKAAHMSENGPAVDSDYRVVYSADQGALILQHGKEDLLKRLEPDSERLVRRHRARVARGRSPLPPVTDPEQRTDTSPMPDPPDVPLALPSEDERDPLSEEEDSDEDYPVPGDDGRGLLTDVPLILGPTEIEVLPMIIMSGIVPPRPDQEGHGSTPQEIKAVKEMHSARCHLLLAQDNGRNLLRELLIFVAAWDLRDDELYFKLMMKIVEAVLTNGLLPFSYYAFKESKDIISPAQAVIMKLLTSIFRGRQAETARQRGLTVTPRTARKASVGSTPYPERNDVHMVSFLFTEFRRLIIPQTCALIFLQGQIRNGTVSPDEFPLNLWDMERMYEGIYQYLEFFAILTEHDVWKQMMADWEITSELVTLLEELDAAIPRSTPRHHPNYKQRAASKALIPYGPEPVSQQQITPAPVAVERPYDVQAEASEGASRYEPQSATPPQQQTANGANYTLPPEDEPSDFEWRNLKKLAVLVLSSLVWKSPSVQHQLSLPDSSGHKGRGVRALLNCCKVDDYNPYIREHAIMALRFALEGCRENQEVVENMERMGEEVGYGGEEGYKLDVPREVLDLNGYETFVDKRGQVQLKKRPAERANTEPEDILFA